MRNLELNSDCILSSYDSGYESTVFNYSDPKHYDDIVLFKLFSNFEHENPLFLENKRKKLEIISTLDVFKDDVKVLDLLYKNGKFCGYTMIKSEAKPITMFDKRKRKLIQLKAIRDKIKLLNSNGIYIGDFNEKNFLSSDGSTIQLCDLDNLRIGDLDFDVMDNAAKKFMKKCSDVRHIDSYCFNIFTVSFLDRYDMAYLMDYFCTSHLPREFDTKKNEEIFRQMVLLDKDYTGEFFIDNPQKRVFKN